MHDFTNKSAKSVEMDVSFLVVSYVLESWVQEFDVFIEVTGENLKKSKKLQKKL